MTFALPAALLGLLLLPVAWWLHKRLRRPPDVVLPSLMFLQDEEEAQSLPRGRVLDAELLLVSAALILLVVAAADPQVVDDRARREVQVVVSGGTPASMRGYPQRVDAVLADVRAGLEDHDILQVVPEPDAPEAGRFVPRPADDALLAAARVGRRSLRVVISDRAAPDDTGDVQWVSVGEPGVRNAGIVATSVVEEADRLAVFGTVVNHAPSAAELRLTATSYDAAGARLPEQHARWNVARDGLASATLSVPTSAVRIVLRLGDGLGLDLDDALAADDRVELTRAPLRVYVHPALASIQDAIRDGLRAVRGEQGFVELPREQAGDAQLAFAPVYAPVPGDGWVLAFRLAAPDDALVRAPRGANPRGRDPLVRDLTAAGIDWLYAPDAWEVPEGARVLLARDADEPWPVLARNERRVLFLPDPVRSVPSVFETPFWPLLVENLVATATGAPDVGAGFRAQGLLDPESSEPGRVQAAFDPAVLAVAEPSVPARARSLRTPLILGALACVLLLWSAPRLRRRLARLQAARTATRPA